jgi:type II secretory pathway pseudopilin PulG
MTLIETIVSIVLVIVIILSVMGTMMQSSVFSRRIDQVYTATYIAQRRIDLLKRLGFDQVSAAGETDIRVDASGNASPDGHYVRTTEVTTDYGGNPSLTKVKVAVKRLKIYMDGGVLDPSTGEMTFIGDPIVMETLFSNIE